MSFIKLWPGHQNTNVAALVPFQGNGGRSRVCPVHPPPPRRCSARQQMPERDLVEKQGGTTANRRQNHRKQAHLALGLSTAHGTVAGRHLPGGGSMTDMLSPGVGRGVACTLTPAQQPGSGASEKSRGSRARPGSWCCPHPALAPTAPT